MTRLAALALAWLVVLAALAIASPGAGVAAAGNEQTPNVDVVEATVAPTAVVTGDATTVTATVANDGAANGSIDLALTANGSTLAERTVAVGGNEAVTATFTPSFEAPGDYALAVNGVAAGTVSVTEPAPNLSVDGATLADADVATDAPVRVTATIANDGSAAGEATVALTAGGDTLDDATVPVAAGATESVELTGSFAEPGTYALAVGGTDAGTVTVVSADRAIEECTTITEAGRYTVVEDLTAPADAAACLAVEHGDVAVDGRGHTLTGSGGAEAEKRTVHYGVRVGGTDGPPIGNVTVSRLTVTDWVHGLHVGAAADVEVGPVTATGNRVGLVAHGSSGVTFRASTASDNTKHGVRVKPRTADVAVRGLTIAGNGDRGIHVTRANLTVEGTTLANNTEGIAIAWSRNSAIRDTTVTNSAEAGISLREVNGTAVVGTRVTGGAVGIDLRGAHEDGHSDDAHSADSGQEEDSHATDDHDDGGCCSAGDVVPGDTLIRNTTVADATVGISLEGARRPRLVDTAVTGSGEWALVAERGSETVTADGLALGADPVTVHLAGGDLSVRPVETPALSEGQAAAAGAVEVVPGDAAVDLRVGYDAASLADRDLAERHVHLWRHDGSWSPVGTVLRWTYDPAPDAWVADAYDGTVVDRDADVVGATVKAGGVFAPLAGAATTDAVGVWNASLSAQAVDDGTAVTARATVTNRGAAETAVRVPLIFDGTVIASETIAVPAGANASLSFSRSPSPGTYGVALADADLGELTVRDVTPPDARAGSDRVATVGEAVAFDARDSTDDVGVAGYRWRFEEGASATGATVSHTFDSPGSYDVRLAAVDAAGNRGTDTVTVTVERSGGGGGGGAPPPSAFDPTVRTRSLSGDRAAVVVERADAGEPLTATLGLGVEDCVGVDALTVWAARDGNYRLEVARADTAETPWAGQDGPALGYVRIDHDDPAPARRARLALRVGNDCLADRGLAPSDVVVYRLTDGEWSALTTRVEDRGATRTRFRVRSPGLSLFAVGTTQPNVSLTGAAPAASPVVAGDRVAVLASLRNDGRANGTVTLTLVADGRPLANRTATVPAGESVTVPIDWTATEPGLYELSVDGVNAGLLLVEPTPTPPPTTAGDVTTPATATPEPPTEERTDAGETLTPDGETAALSPPGTAPPAADQPDSATGQAVYAFTVTLVVLAAIAVILFVWRRAA